MDFLNGLFDGKSLSQTEFEAAMQANGVKLANLADGDYVSQSKYADLNSELKKRDETIADLRGKLVKSTSEKSADEWQAELDAVKEKAEQDAQNYSAALAHERYKNGCKDYARDIHFTSKGARDAFINAMVARKLEVKDGKLIGAEDFRKEYEKNDPDSFVKEGNHIPRIVDRLKPASEPEKVPLSELMKRANAKMKGS